MGAPARQVVGAARAGSLWYVVVPVATFGLLTFVPFVHAAVRLGRPVLWLATAGFAAVAAALVVVSGRPEADVPGPVQAVVFVAALGSMAGGAAVLSRLRREVYGIAPPVDPAVRRVLDARARRADSRHLAATDPLMARELGIGRPDLDGHYDDGGLVDIGSAPAETIAEVCDLTIEQAEEIVAVRDSVVAVEDLFAYVDLPVSVWDRVRDRAILIR